MKKIDLFEICLSSFLLALLIIGSKLSISIGIISLTLQTLIIFLIIGLVRKRCAIFIIGTYIFLGLVGVPVFSDGGGFAYVLKPSFGFIIGFLLAAIVAPNKLNKGWWKLLNSTISLLIIYLCGCVYMYFILNYYMGKSVSVLYVINAGVTPFVVKDYLCAILSTIIAIRLAPIYYKKFELKDNIVISNEKNKMEN